MKQGGGEKANDDDAIARSLGVTFDLRRRSRGRKAKKIYSGGGARSSPPTAGITFCK